MIKTEIKATYTISDGRVFTDKTRAENAQLMRDIQAWCVAHPIDPEMECSPAPGRFTRWLFTHRQDLKEMIRIMENACGIAKTV